MTEDIDTDRLKSIYEQQHRINSLDIASYVILYYDYALTLPDEVERFWKIKSLSWASFFFYLNRYLALLGHIPVIIQTVMNDPRRLRRKMCPSLASFHQYLAVAIQVVAGLILIVRTYALYSRDKRILALISAMGLAAIVYGAYTVLAATHGAATFPDDGCIPPTNHDDATRFANAWTGSLAFDVVIFLMTVFQSLKMSLPGTRTLMQVLLRDGAIYFGIMATVNLVNIVSFHLSPGYERGFVTTFANAISSTMISRLLLNLRDPRLVLRHQRKSRLSTTLAEDTTDQLTHPVLSTVLEITDVTTDTSTSREWSSPGIYSLQEMKSRDEPAQ